MYNEEGVRKGVYGDKKSDLSGRKAKTNIGADGNYIELAENALYTGSKEEQGKVTNNKFHEDAKQWDYYEKTIESDGKYFDVLINVKDTGNAQYVYDITLKEANLPHRTNLSSRGKFASNSSIPKTEQNATQNQKKSLGSENTAKGGTWNIEGKDLALEGNAIEQEVAPVQQQDTAVKDIAPLSKGQKTNVSDDLEQGPFSPVRTVKERNQVKFENYRKELTRTEQDKWDSYDSYNEDIAELQS